METTQNYYHLVGGIVDYIQEKVDMAIREQRKIIIWGFDRGGRFLRHLIEECDGRCKVAYIIDRRQELSISYDAEPAVYRTTILEYLDSEKYMILSTICDIQKCAGEVNKYGYQLGINLFDAYSAISVSYIDYIQKNNPLVDFESVFERANSDSHEYTPFRNSCVDKVFSAITLLEETISFFDFGCGKGSVIVLAHMYGIVKLGGIELMEKVYLQAYKNMKALSIECNLLYGDAAECDDILDEYNCFFLYNSFRGKTFEKVISNIEESSRRCSRNVYLVYANPFQHKAVLKNGYFKLHKQMRIDHYDPILNIYKIEK